jgi:hypothetical protein
MPVSKEDKSLLIDQLENTRTKGSRLVISLMFAGEEAEAGKAKKKVRTLGGKIDDLLAKSMQEWSFNGKILIEEMKKTNQLLQKDISDIKKKKGLAEKIVKAMGHLDKAISTATDVLTKI